MGNATTLGPYMHCHRFLSEQRTLQPHQLLFFSLPNRHITTPHLNNTQIPPTMWSCADGIMHATSPKAIHLLKSFFLVQRWGGEPKFQ